MRSIYKDIQRYTMNARIKVLWKQAESHTTNTSELMDRFAELIIRECVEIAETAEPYKSSDLIKKHFGVE